MKEGMAEVQLVDTSVIGNKVGAKSIQLLVRELNK